MSLVSARVSTTGGLGMVELMSLVSARVSTTDGLGMVELMSLVSARVSTTGGLGMVELMSLVSTRVSTTDGLGMVELMSLVSARVHYWWSRDGQLSLSSLRIGPSRDGEQAGGKSFNLPHYTGYPRSYCSKGGLYQLINFLSSITENRL